MRSSSNGDEHTSWGKPIASPDPVALALHNNIRRIKQKMRCTAFSVSRYYGRDIVALPGNQAGNRENKHRPKVSAW